MNSSTHHQPLARMCEGPVLFQRELVTVLDRMENLTVSRRMAATSADQHHPQENFRSDLGQPGSDTPPWGDWACSYELDEAPFQA